VTSASQFFIKRPVIGLILFYGMLTVPHLDKGLSALDGHGTIASINRILNGEGYIPTRAPGHPATEIILYLPIAYAIENTLQIDFDWEVYNYLQWLGGLACLVSFYALLRRVSASTTTVVVGTLSFVTSHLFLGNAMDGSEFNWGLACLFNSFRLLVLGFRSTGKEQWKQIAMALALTALATGFRQEFVFVFLAYPIFFHSHPKLSLHDMANWIYVPLIVGVLVWLPVFLYNSFSIPMPMPMPETDGLTEFRNRMLGGSYKLLFLGLTLPVVIVLLGWIVRIIESHFKFLNSDHEIIFLYLATTILAATYIGLYFVYPYKPDFILLVIPMLILLSASTNWKNELYCLCSATIFSLVVQIDIFDNRRLVFPHIQDSLYWQKVKGKPHYKKDSLQKEIGLVTSKQKVLLLTDLWWNDFNYLLGKEMISLTKLEKMTGRNFELYHNQASKADLLIASRRAIEGLPHLLEFQNKGYEICVSERFLRSFFFKYDVRLPLGDRVRIGQVNFTII